MPRFTFDMLLAASITVEADNPETARAWLVEALDAADTNFGCYPNQEPILGEVSLANDVGPVLALIDGEEVPDLPPLYDAPSDRAMFDLLCENFDAWDGEEDSVKEEHDDLIEKTEAFIDENKARFNGTAAAKPMPDAVLRDCLGALNACLEQIGQMRGMFGDEDGTIQAAVDAAEEAQDKARSALA